MSTTTTAAMSSLELNMGDDARAAALDDYRIVCVSREASLLGRKEVLGGKAKFGIFGDGKEVAQIALARQFRKGDFRSGYYRDQTLMMTYRKLATFLFLLDSLKEWMLKPSDHLLIVQKIK